MERGRWRDVDGGMGVVRKISDGAAGIKLLVDLSETMTDEDRGSCSYAWE